MSSGRQENSDVTASDPDSRRAEAAPPPADPLPLRFGLWALFVLVAVCCVQFALMSYVGVLPGLLVSAVVCGGVLAVLIVFPIVARIEPDSRSMAHLDVLAIRLTMAIVLLVVGSFLAGGGRVVVTVLSDAFLARGLKRDLGFSYARDQVLDEGVFREVIAIRSVTSGGPMDQAGFQKGDAIVTDLSVRDYLAVLDENRGQTIAVTVASGSSGGSVFQSWDKWPRRELELAIPE